MDNSVSRRLFLGGTATAGLGFAFAGDGSLEAFARPEPRPPAPMTGYGPLIPDPKKILALPAGFSYKIIATSGDPIDDGSRYASDPDGMAVFAGPAGGSVLVTNHEYGAYELHRVTADPALTYDPGALIGPGPLRSPGSYGGTTTITVDAEGNRVGAYVSLAGTENNCAGGITPWGTWLTCEETERRKDTTVAGAPAGTTPRRLAKDHGYVFEVHPTNREANVNPVPLTFLGRYSHEAVAVDPRTYEIYLTEDAATPNGLYYRWQPPANFEPKVGSLRKLATEPDGVNAGRLQAMSCYWRRQHIVDLSQATEVGTRYRVRWIDVPDRTGGVAAGVPPLPIRSQTFSSPITRSRKLEGQWWGNGGAYFVASFARPLAAGDGSLNEHDGQVWFYNPQNETVTLKTIFGMNEIPRPSAGESVNYDGPDNITVSPHGGLILAEDGSGIQHLIGVSRRGVAYPLARNEVYVPPPATADSEFCGPTFSADGRILFVNMYSPGYTFAITGPWRRDRF